MTSSQQYFYVINVPRMTKFNSDITFIIDHVVRTTQMLVSITCQ